MTYLPRPAIVPPLGNLDPLPALTITPRKIYAEPIKLDELALVDAVTTSALVREVQRKLAAEDARLRRLLPPPLPGHEWRAEISSSTEHDVDAFTMHETIRLRYRLVAIEECARCEGDRWVDDPSACGDPDHCSPIVPCPVCNPDGSRE